MKYRLVSLTVLTLLVLDRHILAQPAPPSPAATVGSAFSFQTQPSPPEPAEPEQTSLFRDPEDGAFDVSSFLDSKTGFLPLVIPITEPAVGFGLAGGLAFFHTRPQLVQTDAGPRMIPPTASFVAGAGTENGTWFLGGGHLHTWKDGRVRYLVGAGYGSVNLDWFGQSDAFDGRAFALNLELLAVIQKLTFKLGDSDFFAGPTQRLLATRTDFAAQGEHRIGRSDFGVFEPELDATVSGVGVTLGYDTRDSLFSPTRGTKASVTYTWNNEAIGSDFDYGRIDAEVCHYLPLGGPFTLGLRASGTYAGDDAPFFDLGIIQLRGIQIGRYIDNVAVTAEAELRWDVTPRWTVVGFGGAGWVADQFDALDDADTHPAGGVGFRYLLARKYDLRLGCDIAHGPEDWAFYVTVGTGWLRD